MLTPYQPADNFGFIEPVSLFAFSSFLAMFLFLVVIPLVVAAMFAIRFKGMLSDLYGVHHRPPPPQRLETQSDRDWHVRRTGVRLSSVCLWVGIGFLAAGLWRAQEMVGEVALFDMVTIKNASPGIVLIVISFVFYYLASHPRR